MKLADLDIIVTAPPAPGWGGRYWIIPKVTTDTGIIGYVLDRARGHEGRDQGCF